MRVVKCALNHFFDADKYTTCPQCGAGIGTENSAASSPSRNESVPETSSSRSGETFGVFKKSPFKPLKRESAPAKTAQASDNYEKLKTFQNKQGGNSPAMNSNSLLGGNPAPKPAPVPAPFVPSIQESAPVEIPEVSNPVSSEAPIAPVASEVLTFPETRADANTSSEPIQEKTSVQSTDESLLEEIKKVTADNDGKTVGFFSSGRASASESEESEDKKAVPANVPSEEPVVGWLICIKGPNLGQCFNIYAGKNSLGRSNTNKIIVNKDKSISRDKHSWIIYEPKNRDFFAQPGDSSGLTYVNDEMIMQATKLEKKSIIEVGNTRLMLIPLCGDDFSWEEYL